MRKLIIGAALAIVTAAPAHAGLPAGELQGIISLIKTRYVPAGLTADEITVLLKTFSNRWVMHRQNADGSVTFWYEQRDQANEVVELSAIVTVRLLAAPAAR